MQDGSGVPGLHSLKPWRKRRQVQQSFSHLFLSFPHFTLKAIDMDEFECLLSDLLKAMSGNRICMDLRNQK